PPACRRARIAARAPARRHIARRCRDGQPVRSCADRRHHADRAEDCAVQPSPAPDPRALQASARAPHPLPVARGLMNLIRPFIRRPMADRVLVAQAIAVHLCIAALLRAVGLRRVMAWSDARTPARSRHMICPDAETRVAWAVRTAAYLLPMGRTCLT